MRWVAFALVGCAVACGGSDGSDGSSHDAGAAGSSQDANAGTGGTSGTSGTSGASGTGGTSGTGGAAGGAGAGASGGAGADGGAGASGGAGADGGAGASGGAGADGGAGASGGAGAAGTDGGAGAAGSDAGASGPKSIFVVEGAPGQLADDTFFDQPWPSDLRVDASGALEVAGFPEPRQSGLLDLYKTTCVGMFHGASPVAAGFARFEAPVAAASLPADPLASLSPTSSVQLIDVDPASPEHGQRRPISLELHNDAGVYWPSNTLATMPLLGDPLLPSTRYALVVTDALRATTGEAFRAADDLRAVLGLAPGNAATDAAQTALAPAVAEIEAAGIARSHVVQLAVFTTSDPAGDVIRVRDDVRASFQAPDVLPNTWQAKETLAGVYDAYEGMYGPSPDYQRGTVPFETVADGGELAFDANGNPQVQRTFDLRFVLTVPIASNCPPPAGGYPIVLYAHGTGGNYRTMMGAGDEAAALAKRCIAAMGIDQIFHGTRPGSGSSTSVELLVYNFANPYSARGTGPESAIDVVQQARLFTETMISVPSAVSKTGSAIRFDPTRVLFFGHSQGGLNGSIFLAIDDQARGGALSGSGSVISIAMLEKTQPLDIPTLIKDSVLLLQPSEYAELTLFHPWVSFAQNISDPTDTINYVPMIARRPRSGFAPKSVLMTEGVRADGTGDNYAPPHGIEVGAIALGLPPQTPVIHMPVELAYGGPQPVTVPVGGLSGNLAGGQASGVLAQWDPGAGEGHFVIYNIPAAMAQAAQFVANLSSNPVGLVPVP